MEILGIVLSHAVTIVGVPSYTSGAQLWNGAAATLNRKPAPISTSPSCTPETQFSTIEQLSLTDSRL